jgi:hypothetical protein
MFLNYTKSSVNSVNRQSTVFSKDFIRVYLRASAANKLFCLNQRTHTFICQYF